MSLLIEPANRAACIRNEKERLLMQGQFKKRSQADYVLAHMGLTYEQLYGHSRPQYYDRKKSTNRSHSRSYGGVHKVASSSQLSGVQPLTEKNLTAATQTTRGAARSKSTGALARPSSARLGSRTANQQPPSASAARARPSSAPLGSRTANQQPPSASAARARPSSAPLGSRTANQRPPSASAARRPASATRLEQDPWPSQTAARPPSRGAMSSLSTEVSEAAPYVPLDPVLTAMMNGPPLFSPALCSKVALTLF
eukprot:TRINITY_DN20167_c0_g1_i1.p1 TRINITY_DN20167_c0_g1~~TRINITY_DN20167_c0_g1_i1.p1  ORF type:complete len:255 (+),score=29.44 TRINITY_DN20167_c0_g1_i1:84-848(+)